MVALIIYLIAAYWAAGYTIYADKVVIETKLGSFFIQRLCVGALLGIILIPWAILKLLLGGK